MGMIESADGGDFPPEEALPVVCLLLREGFRLPQANHFDGDLPQAYDILGQIDLTHRAMANRMDKPVMTELFAVERHRHPFSRNS